MGRKSPPTNPCVVSLSPLAHATRLAGAIRGNRQSEAPLIPNNRPQQNWRLVKHHQQCIRQGVRPQRSLGQLQGTSLQRSHPCPRATPPPPRLPRCPCILPRRSDTAQTQLCERPLRLPPLPPPRSDLARPLPGSPQRGSLLPLHWCLAARTRHHPGKGPTLYVLRRLPKPKPVHAPSQPSGGQLLPMPRKAHLMASKSL